MSDLIGKAKKYLVYTSKKNKKDAHKLLPLKVYTIEETIKEEGGRSAPVCFRWRRPPSISLYRDW